MRLHSGAPFWLLQDALALPNDRGALATHERCDVVVVGAGITGALTADALTREGLDVVVIDKREPGVGSTAASTAILLYETDAELAKLAAMVGEEHAVRAYALGRDAIGELQSISAELSVSCTFTPVAGLYLASSKRDVSRLKNEVTLRRRFGFDVAWLESDELRRAFGLCAAGAIRSSNAATLDPLQLTRQLLLRAERAGARVYRGTTIIAHHRSGARVAVRTKDGYTIEAGRVVYAVGYELPPDFPADLVRLHSTFAIVTERPTHDDGRALSDVAVWESARPYAYLRATADGRVMIGGRDAPFKNETLRDALLPRRIPQLERRLGDILPDLHRETAFAWSGTFGETHDTLPYIGPLPSDPAVLFALGYGGNGITFSAIAARMIADICTGRKNDDIATFALDR